MGVCTTNTLKLFLENSSIRGFSRIVRSKSRFIRYLWGLFVIFTTIFLAYSVFKIIQDFLKFSVNIQTTLEIDDGSPFPAVTFCNHQPFSEKAYEMWGTKKVMSPTAYNEAIRKGAYYTLKSELINRPYGSMEDLRTLPLAFSIAWDALSNYYQNISSDVAVQLGHNVSIIYNCVWYYNKNMAIATRCDDPMLKVKNFSHPNFFNCFTVEVTEDSTNDVTQLGLIIWLGPGENHNVGDRQGFLSDIFQQAYGLRVVVHEPGSLPNVDAFGIQVEPGKMNEINFQTVKMKMTDTAKKPCIEKPDIQYKDLDNTYSYAIELCLNIELQKRIVKECKCVYYEFPRYIIPTPELPYCGAINPKDTETVLKRLICLTNILEDKIKFKKKLEVSKCLRRCETIEYENTVSVTKWRPTQWQLYWIQEIHILWNALSERYKYNQTYTKELEKVNMFFLMKNLSSYHDKSSFVFDDRYTYLMVKRKTNNTFVKVENLVLTTNALFSRIGGLCSLYIGMTLAFFIEVIEFIYLTICGSNEPDHEGRQKALEHQKMSSKDNSYPSSTASNIRRPVLGGVVRDEDSSLVPLQDSVISDRNYYKYTSSPPTTYWENGLGEEQQQTSTGGSSSVFGGVEEQIWVPKKQSQPIVVNYYTG